MRPFRFPAENCGEFGLCSLRSLHRRFCFKSRFVSVAVNNKPRNIDLLHMTYAQQSIIGSGGYMPEDVRDVQEIMSCGKWDLESIITHEFPLVELERAIRMAGDVAHAGNVVVKMETA